MDQDLPAPEVAPSPPAKFGPKHTFLILGILLFLFLVISIGTVIYLLLYTQIKLPLVNANVRSRFDSLAYKIPLLPKTPRQVLTAASATDKALTSYTADFSFSAKQGSAALTAGSLDLNLTGPLDFSTPQNPKFDITAAAQINVAGTSLRLSGKARGVDKIVYFKLDELPVESLNNLLQPFLGLSLVAQSEGEGSSQRLAPVLSNWIKYDTSGLDTQARAAMEQTSQSQSVIDTSRRRIQNILSDDSVMPEVKLVGRENVDSVPTYHLRARPSREAVKRIVREFVGDENLPDLDGLVSSVDEVVIDAWFGTADALPRKVSALLNINLGTLSSSSPATLLKSLGTGSLSLSWVLQLTDIGQQVTVEVPQSAVSPGDYWGMLTTALKSPEQIAREAQQTQYTTDFSAISAGLLKHFVDRGSYPSSLKTVFGDKYSSYNYRLTKNGQGYVLYIEMPSDGSYFGVTSGYSYPHTLKGSDFQ